MKTIGFRKLDEVAGRLLEGLLQSENLPRQWKKDACALYERAAIVLEEAIKQSDKRQETITKSIK